METWQDACNNDALPHLQSFCTPLPHWDVIMIYMTNTVCSLPFRQLWMYHAAIYWWIAVRCITIQFPRQTQTTLQGFNKCSLEPQPVEWQILSCFITLLSYGLLKYTEHVRTPTEVHTQNTMHLHTLIYDSVRQTQFLYSWIIIRLATCFDPTGSSSSGLHYEPIDVANLIIISE